MKIKISENIKVDIRTLIEVRKTGKLPRLYVHEKFAKILKWIVWIISTISFVTIFIIIENYYISISIGVFLTILSTIFSTAIVKYTSIIVQPYPNFKIDYDQWENVMTVSDPDYKNKVNLVGFVYKDITYGKQFFNYIKSWNFNNAHDKDKNITLSIVEELNGAYTFYLYASPFRKNLGKIFKAIDVSNYSNKKKIGKTQEGLVMQMVYWKTIKYIDNKHIKDFLRNQPNDDRFMLIPVKLESNGHSFDLESQITLNGYKFSNRKDLHKNSFESLFVDDEI